MQTLEQDVIKEKGQTMIQNYYLLQTKNNLYTGQGQRQEGGSKRHHKRTLELPPRSNETVSKDLGPNWHVPDVAHTRCGTHCHPRALEGGLQM